MEDGGGQPSILGLEKSFVDGGAAVRFVYKSSFRTPASLILSHKL